MKIAFFPDGASTVPAAALAALNAVAQYLDHVFTNNITVNIEVGWGEVGGTVNSTPLNGTTNPGVGGEENAETGDFVPVSYSTLVSYLQADAHSKDQITAANNLLASGDFTGGATIQVPLAEARALGLYTANNNIVDAWVGFNTTTINNLPWDFDSSYRAVPGEVDFMGLAEHEITHALGRTSGDGSPSTLNGQIFGDTPLDLFRYASPGHPDLSGNGSSDYFSFNDGYGLSNNPLDTSFLYNQSGDISDWTSFLDSFGEYNGQGGTGGYVSETDLREMNVLGFNRAPATHNDVTGDGVSDVLWYSSSTLTIGDWSMHGAQAQWSVLGRFSPGYSTVGIGDFTGNGTADLLWENTSTGAVSDWLMDNNQPTSQQVGQGSTTMKVAGVGDFNGDGTADILWQNPSNNLVGEWLMSNNSPTWELVGQGSTTMNIVGLGDFDGSGRSDILWENPTNNLVGMWAMNGAQATWSLIGQGSTTMQIVGTGNLTGNGTDDILWQNPSNGVVGYWGMSNGQATSWNVLATASSGYQVVGVDDYYGNGRDDIMWRNPGSGDVGIWAMNNGQPTWHDIGASSTSFNVVNS
jgi:hypothetical protein